jgi:protocatechuate 3,4-dioxygenase beta subunit
MTEPHRDDHNLGLAYDLDTIARHMMGRRRALAWFAGVGGAALVAGCGGGGSESSDGTTTTSTTTTTGTTTGTTTTTGSTTGSTSGTTTSGSCVVSSTETNGPYPADGTNQSSGATSNVLTQSGVIRSDIRPSFLSSTTVAQGVAVTLTITLVNVNNSCAPLQNYAIYLWQCDANGAYSLYSLPTESYLRGVQTTDANGQVTFTTIVPGCYEGRWPHIHFEVYASLAGTTTGRSAALISQFAIPTAVCSAVYATSAYSGSVGPFSRVSLANDNVFGDNSAAQLAQQTPTMSGSASAGYTATVQVGVAV